MFEKYDHRLVKSYKSYTLQELCRLYKEDQLHIQTIRGWLRNGELPSIKDGNKHLIYGAVFKKFLFERNKKHKKHMHFKEFKCCACKQINVPLETFRTYAKPCKLRNRSSFKEWMDHSLID